LPGMGKTTEDISIKFRINVFMGSSSY